MSPIRSAAVITLATLALFSSCGAEDGNGNVVTELRTLRSFQRLHVTDGLTVTVTNGPQQVSITTDSDLQNNLVTDVDGDELKIRLSNNEDIAPTILQIEVTMPELEALVVKGHSTVSAVATYAGEWRLHVENESNVLLTNVTGEKFVAHITDRARAEVSGQVLETDIDLHDASLLEASQLSASRARIDISGGSQASLNATQEIEIDSAGNSRVVVSGNPQNRDVDADRGSEIVFTNQ
jgi:hypothetical protein